MEKFIHHIYIRNFKSLKSCELVDCKRINLFIGRPNVGKSNIIEALSMFTIPFLKENSSKKLSSLVRIENESELFYNGNWDEEAKIETNQSSCLIQYNPKIGLKAYLGHNEESYGANIDERLNIASMFTTSYTPANIKRYVYNSQIKYKKGHSKYLIPPFGHNLLSIIENYPNLRKAVVDFFSEYKLEIAFDKSSQTIKILQRNKGEIFLIPYNSIADTLQRIIFYKAAIESNTDCTLLFEEPEAHSFPPYMTHLTQEMIYKKDNQFFIATHSPFILNNLLENAQEELAVFNVDYKDNQTQIKRLTSDELHEAYQSGVDFFTNNETFL